MLNTLFVSYTPRDESNTERLFQTALEHISTNSKVTHLNLSKTPTPLLLEDNLNPLLKRNFMGMDLTPSEAKLTKNLDDLLKQLLDADRLVMAFPMYNFSLPAAVKAWIDAVIQNNSTFKINEEGNYEGLCHDKKALILMSTGSDFSKEPLKNMNFATPLIQTCLGFMGIESYCITAYGLNQYPNQVENIITQTQSDILNYLQTNSTW